MIDKSIIFSALNYNPEVGDFTWKKRPDKPNNWNARFAGSRAGVRDKFYVYITINYKKIAAHNLAWLFATGSWPSHIIDHIDGNGFNNALVNLREATYEQNGRNRKRTKSAATPISGVRRVSRGRPWRASICVKGRQIHLGTYDKLQDAITARLVAEDKYFGEFSPIKSRHVKAFLTHYQVETREAMP